MQVDLSTKNRANGLAKVIPPGPASLAEAKLQGEDVMIHHDTPPEN